MAVDVTQIIEPIQKALGPVSASLSEAWSAVIGDRIAAWRLTNAAALQVVVNSEVGKLGLRLDRSKIPERYAFAWFEEATKQDEPEIQVLFARLLARAAAGDEDASDRRHVEILTRLTPMDAKVMEWLFANPSDPLVTLPSWNEYDVWKVLRGLWGQPSTLSIEHLITIGVLERSYAFKRDYSQNSVVGLRLVTDDIMGAVQRAFVLGVDLIATETGMSLMRAITPITPSEGCHAI